MFEKKSGDLSAIPALNVTEKNLVNALVLGGIYKSRSEAKNGILGGAVRINEEKILDPMKDVEWEDDMVLSVGKKHHYRVVKAYS